MKTIGTVYFHDHQFNHDSLTKLTLLTQMENFEGPTLSYAKDSASIT